MNLDEYRVINPVMSEVAGKGWLGTIKSLNIWTACLTAIWIAVVVTVIILIRHEGLDLATELALKEARDSCTRDILTRKFFSIHGEVDGLTSESTPSDQYRIISDKDISNETGRDNTRLNPARMMRDIYDFSEQNDGSFSKIRITSLNPLNPSNVPNEWERRALESFENGSGPVTSVIPGEEVRLIMPITVDISCLKCHGDQGYNVGDIHGGISVSVSLAEYLVISENHVRDHLQYVAVFGMIGFLLLGMLYFQARSGIEDRVKAGTLLSNSADVLDKIESGILIFKLEDDNHDDSLKLIDLNSEAESILKTTKQQCMGKFISELFPELFTADVQKTFAEIVRTGSSAVNSEPNKKFCSLTDDHFSFKAFPLPENRICVICDEVTDSVRSEMKLIESREKYSLLFNQMSDAFALHEIIFDDEGNPVNYKYIDINPAFEKLFKVSKEYLLSGDGHRAKKYLWFDEFNDVALTGEYTYFTTFSPEFNKHFEITAYSPKKNRVACIFKDVTKRTASEKALQALIKSSIETEGQSFFDTVTESLAHWLKADSVMIGKINDERRFETFSNYTDNTYVESKSYSQQDFPCSLEMGRDLYIIPENVTDHFSGSTLLKELNAESICSMVLKSEGKLLGFICCVFRRKYEPDESTISVLRSITAKTVLEIEREYIASKLKENQKRFQSIMDNAHALVCILDLDHRYVLVNRKYESVLNVKSEFIIGEKIYDILEQNLADRYVSESIRVLNEDAAHTFSETFAERDGKVRYFLTTIFPLKDADDKTYAICSITLDQTNQKQAEEGRRQLEKQLIQAQKMESIGRLAGGIAHDFNNILTGILGYAELLQFNLKETGSEDSLAAGYIMKGAERAANLTKQLLGFARGGKYNPVSLDLNEVITDTVNVSEKIFDKRVEVVFDLKDDIHLVEADRNQMDQVFTNLLINARDAMPDGGRLRLTTDNVYMDDQESDNELRIKSGDYVRVSVRDSGVGIPDEIKSKIFEPFFTTKDVDKGTGLGLATVYGIIKNHNGYVFVESSPGKGSEFILCIPACDADETDDNYESGELYKGDSTILIVDDEEIVRNTTSKMLTNLGYHTIFACNGIEAVEIYKERSEEIDLVLLDFIMPHMDGQETKTRLEKINPDVKIVLASGYSNRGKTEKILKSGNVEFLQKPFRIHTLSKTISESLVK